MQQILCRISTVLDYVYGCGIFICLFVGGSMFFGYLAAFAIGGDTAAGICEIIYNIIYKYLIYGGNIIVLLGLVNMYIKKQKSLTMTDNSRESVSR